MPNCVLCGSVFVTGYTGSPSGAEELWGRDWPFRDTIDFILFISMTTWAGNLSRWEELVKRLCHKGSILLIQVNSVLMSYRGEHWGVPNSYPIPQYRTKNWQIQKCRVENGRNTDTAFMIGDAYLTLYPSREFFFFLSQACIHPKSSKYWTNAIPWRISFYWIPLAWRMKNRIPHGWMIPQYRTLKSKFPKYRLKKSSIPQYRKPPCPPPYPYIEIWGRYHEQIS